MLFVWFYSIVPQKWCIHKCCSVFELNVFSMTKEKLETYKRLLTITDSLYAFHCFVLSVCLSVCVREQVCERTLIYSFLRVEMSSKGKKKKKKKKYSCLISFVKHTRWHSGLPWILSFSFICIFLLKQKWMKSKVIRNIVQLSLNRFHNRLSYACSLVLFSFVYMWKHHTGV